MNDSGSTQTQLETSAPTASLLTLLYLGAFVTGAIVMSFEMLGSRFLAPHFGSGIYTWASLISTVLAALCAGYFLGGLLADRHPSRRVLGITVLVGSVYLLLLPAFAEPVLEFLVWQIDDIKLGSLVSSLAVMFFPVAFLGMYSPFAVRLLLRSSQNSGMVSGTVYGVSTAGSIVGTLGTTFFLIPLIGSRAITLTLGVAGIATAVLLIATAPRARRASAVGLAALLAWCGLALPAPSARAEALFDPDIRAALVKRKDGLIARIETVYNEIFISKTNNVLKMGFQWNGWHYVDTLTNLTDPDDLPQAYARLMTVAAIYPGEPKRVLMLGLGGGAISTHLARFLPEATIDSVELDPGVINAAKKYFGLRETSRARLHASDGRVFLNRNSGPYDLIIVDAFQGSYIPFHMMTKEFYRLVRERLAPDGVAAFNIHPGTKLYDSNLRTLRTVYDDLDLYHSGEEEVIVMTPLKSVGGPEGLLQKAAAAQERYKFRFDPAKLLTQRIETPRDPKGDVLTDDFAPVDVYDASGRSYKRKKKQ